MSLIVPHKFGTDVKEITGVKKTRLEWAWDKIKI